MLILQILFIFLNVKQKKCLNDLEGNIIFNNSKDDKDFIITPGIVETKYLYKRETPFNFIFSNETNYLYDLIINFYSINCKINIKIYNKSNMNDIGKALPHLIGHDKDSYSIRINKSEIKNTLINIEPLNNDLYYNYNRTYPLVINSIIIDDKESTLKIDEKDPIYIHFNKTFNKIILSYELKNITNDSFAALFFSYHENAFFEVIVLDENKSEMKKKILNPLDFDNIFLTEELQLIKNLFIEIEYLPQDIDDYKNQALLKFEIKTNKSPPTILEKNYINKGLITSNLEYKHFYFEVFEGEGGELILHDKRQSGILIGSIIQKENINNITNPDIYPKINQSNSLKFDKHLLKLYFNFEDTNMCTEGCYILISYYHEKFNTTKNIIIGSEFTLLLRIWDDIEFNSQIINIPLNEYVFGFFEKGSVKRHYYSIYITDSTDEIEIQIQGTNIEGFYGSGKRKINEDLIWYDVKELNFSKSKDIKPISTAEYQNDYMSFLIKPIKNSFSIYYFRILKKDNENGIILPLDSNLGNNCILENNYCYFLLKNDYNIFSLNLTIFISEQYADYSIYSKNIDVFKKSEFDDYINGTDKYISDFKNYKNQYINVENDINVEYVFLIIYVNNEERIITNNILSTFYDVRREINPNIYSSRLYKLDYISKYVNISLEKDFKINFCSFYGEGIVTMNDFFKNQIFTQNMLRQYYKIPLKNNITNINFQDIKDFTFYIKLINFKMNRRIKIGKTLNDFIQNEEFPLFYTIPLEKEDNHDLDINFKIINLNDNLEKDTNFEIEGSITNLRESERIMNYGKQFENAIKGEYDLCTKIGFLNLPFKFNNSFNNNEDKTVLIKISGINDYNNMNIFIQILAIKNNLVIPIDQYILSSINQINHEYNIIFLERKNITLELHTNKQNLELFNLTKYKEKNEDGIIKYFIDPDQIEEENKENAINFKIISLDNKLIGKYMLKYNYEPIEEIEEYKFMQLFKDKRKKINDPIFDFEFSIIKKGNNLKDLKDNINFIIYSYLYLLDNNNETQINLLNSLIPNSIQPFSKTKQIVNAKDKNFKISFNNELKDHNKNNYILQIKININKDNNHFSNKYLVYSIKGNFDKDKGKEMDISITLIIFAIMLIIIIVIVILIFVIYYKMKKKNLNLEELLKTSFKDNERKKEEEEEQNKSFSYI